MKIVLNKCIGCFELSEKAKELYKLETGNDFAYWNRDRNDPALIKVVEQLKREASGFYSNLKVVIIPDNCFYELENNEGFENIYYSMTEIEVV